MYCRGSSQQTIVRPALLSIIGVYSPFYIATVFFPRASVAGGNLLITIFGVEVILAGGAWLSAVSILLLLDHVRHRIWGSLAAISYILAFPSLFFYSWFGILVSTQFGILSQAGAGLAMITPLIGLSGGVWGFLWKPPRSTIPPETLATKPGRWRFPNDKPVIPALLSVAGTALPVFLLSEFVMALFAPPQPPQEGGVGPNFGFLLLPLLVGAAAFLVLLPAVLSIFLVFDPRHHKKWGAVLTVWWGLGSAYVFVAIVNSLVNLVNGTYAGTSSLSWETLLFFTPLLGLVGAVWGFYWHTGVNPRAWTHQTIARTLRGLSGRVTAGGLASFVFGIIASPGLAIIPFFLVVGNIRFRKSGVGSRTRGIVLMGLVVGSALFLLVFEVIEYLNAPWDLGPRIAGIASIVATVLAGSGLVWSIRGPLISRWKRLSTAVVFFALVILLVGSIFAYAVVTIQARENLPKPIVTLTNIGGTYVEDCGPSGTQTTTFNMTSTMVNTGGFGVATLGYVVNGQQVASEGYYVHPNTQVTYFHIVTIHACYVQPPTYTVVLLSEQAA